MPDLELVDHRRLSERAYELIKEHILTADLRDQPPGSRLDEKLLCDQLRMSRTPVREAINRLAAEGLLKLVPYKGVFIAKKTSEEIISYLMVRATLEGMAARLATANFTSEDFVTMKDIFFTLSQRAAGGATLCLFPSQHQVSRVRFGKKPVQAAYRYSQGSL